MGANDPSRRRFLAGAGAVAAGTAAASLLPPSLQRALAAPLRTSGGSLRDIEHVVFLMQENRSFDHYYGVLRGVRGYSDRSAIRLRTGEPVFRQPGTGQRWTSAYYEPFLARDGRSVPPFHSDPNTIGTLPHNWESQHLAMAGGWHDDWIRAKQMAEFAGDLPHGMNEHDLRWAEGLVIPGWATTMAHYDRKDIPFHYELADTFTICDAYHCSLIGGTNPNRLYHYSGKLGIEPNGTPSVTNYSSDGPAGQPGFTHPTYPELLSKAGKTWKVYQEWDNFGDNALEYFASFRAIARKLVADWDGTSYDGFGPFYDALAGWSSSAQAEAAAELGRRVKSRLTESERARRAGVGSGGVGEDGRLPHL
jgi:phospholipase C